MIYRVCCAKIFQLITEFRTISHFTAYVPSVVINCCLVDFAGLSLCKNDKIQHLDSHFMSGRRGCFSQTIGVNDNFESPRRNSKTECPTQLVIKIGHRFSPRLYQDHLRVFVAPAVHRSEVEGNRCFFSVKTT